MIRYLYIIGLIFITYSCSNSKKETVENYRYTNELINETSPYLLQHAHNPVNWRAWNEETLEAAKNENKLMIISVGYAACHWCHVMEHESFEDSLVAQVMNANFISVKVDREERPDIDQVYINAVQLMTGSAGWPLNVITLPDGRPVWGGTYFKKEDWINALEQIQTVYKDSPEKLEAYATKLEDGIKSMDLITLNTDAVNFKEIDTKSIVKDWENSFDTTFGGFKRSPKFMMPSNFSFLLRYAHQEKDSTLLNYVNTTLTKIAFGGIYDHIGGGFSRYSTDLKWHVPHFEKMLYDNAQLVELYCNAYAVTKNPLYKEVVTQTLEFIERDMTNPEGAFYSSLDADSTNEAGELEEGAFYTFSKEELQNTLGNDFELFSDYYNINDFGIWEENRYVLIRKKLDSDFCNEHNISQNELNNFKEKWRSTLLNYRNKRPKTRLDDKSLTSWNALMLRGYLQAYKTFGNDSYLSVALKNANFISTKQSAKNGQLMHSYKDNQSTINGYLEDYAAVISAYISLYEVTLDTRWIDSAKNHTDYAIEHFYNEASGMFYFTSDEDKSLVSRSTEYRDNVIPASNSIMAKNLAILSHHYDSAEYIDMAKQMLKNVLEEIPQYPGGFSNWLDVLQDFQKPFYEVVIVGDDAKTLLSNWQKSYRPNTLTAGSTIDDDKPLLSRRYIDNETLIYICVNNACKLPVATIEEAEKLLSQ